MHIISIIHTQDLYTSLIYIYDRRLTMEEVGKDKHKIKIVDLLKNHPEGLTISDIMRKLALARHTVLARLHHLVGKGDVDVRQINMAKVHYFKGQEEKKDQHPMLQQIQLTTLKEDNIQQAPKRIEPAEEKKDDSGYYETQVKPGKSQKDS